MKIWYFLKNEGKFTTYIHKMEYFHKYYPFLEEVFIIPKFLFLESTSDNGQIVIPN